MTASERIREARSAQTTETRKSEAKECIRQLINEWERLDDQGRYNLVSDAWYWLANSDHAGRA